MTNLLIHQDIQIEFIYGTRLFFNEVAANINNERITN